MEIPHNSDTASNIYKECISIIKNSNSSGPSTRFFQILPHVLLGSSDASTIYSSCNTCYYTIKQITGYTSPISIIRTKELLIKYQYTDIALNRHLYKNAVLYPILPPTIFIEVDGEDPNAKYEQIKQALDEFCLSMARHLTHKMIPVKPLVDTTPINEIYLADNVDLRNRIEIPKPCFVGTNKTLNRLTGKNEKSTIVKSSYNIGITKTIKNKLFGEYLLFLVVFHVCDTSFFR